MVSFDIKLKLINIIYLNKNKTIYYLSKKSNTSYCYTLKIIEELINEGIVIKIYKTKSYKINLTKKGDRISELFSKILEEFII